MSNSQWTTLTIGDVTAEVKDRLGGSTGRYAVYGVDRSAGLTPISKYTSDDLSRYKWLLPEMFVYNPMRLNIGSIGYCSDQHEPGLVSPDYVVFRCDRNHLEPDFLKYYILSTAWQGWTEGSGVGSVRVRIYYRELAQMPITLPPLPEQRAIAYILGTLDDKIELNRRMNETLETMARVLFKSWFVDFDPVRAKMDGRWRPGESLSGLPAHLYDLFPDRLRESEIEDIPEGWEMHSLDEIACFLNGLALQKYPPEGDHSLPVIKIAQLRAGNTEGADRASANLDPAYVVQNGDILFSWSGSLECVLWGGGPGALNQHLFRVTSDKYPRWLCYLGIHLHLEDFRHIAAGKATTMGHIQRHHLSDAKLAIPSLPVLQAMDTIIGPIVESTWPRQVQSCTLASLRDTLLPKLISGELRVEDAERFIAEVGV